MLKILILVSFMMHSSLMAKAYQLVPAASSLKWEGGKKILVTDKHFGTAKIKSGVADIDGKNLKSAQFIVDMNSIVNRTNNAKLIGHLKSDDFFAVAKNPTAILDLTKSKKIKKKDTYLMSGTLTLRGNTAPISFQTQVKSAGPKMIATASFEIDRTKWGVIYGSNKSLVKGAVDKIIKKEIKFDIKVTLESKAVVSSKKNSKVNKKLSTTKKPKVKK